MPFDPSALRRPTREVLYEFAGTYLPETLRLLRVPLQDVADVVQATVEIAYKKLDHYDPGERAPEAALRRWLGIIAWYHLQNERARARQWREVSASDVVEEAAAGASEDAGAETPELRASREERLRIMDGILSTLGPERREVLLLHDGLGLTAEEIADKLGLNEESVKSHWQRARRQFKAAVERLPPDQRSLLEGTVLALPLAFLWAERSAWGSEPREHAPVPERQGSTLVGIAGAVAAMAVVGMALGPDASSRAVGPALRPATIVAAHEASPDTAHVMTIDTTAPAGSASPPTVEAPSPPRMVVPATRSKPRATATTDATDDPLSREMALLRAARRALDQGAYTIARKSLDAHAAKFPRSSLTSWRDGLRSEMAAALRRGAGRARLSR